VKFPAVLKHRKTVLSALVAATLGIAVVSAADAQARPRVAADHGDHAAEQLPRGFSEHLAKVGDIHLNYVIGGHGPTLVLIHGYPQTWYEWHGIMPILAQHYTVIAPDLRGAGKSDAPAGGYDKKTMAADIHTLLAGLGRDHDVRIVGHDIGTMVAYAYAAANPADVTKLVLSEAPIPDPSIYQFPSLTAGGPGVWNFGFFNITNGLPENLIDGRETTWTGGFIDQFEVKKGSVTPQDVAVFARPLRDPAHLEASLDWFRVFPQDIKDDEQDAKTMLPMPVLAIGADHSLGGAVASQVEQYATNVTGVVIPDSGHWIYEEHPAELTGLLLKFLQGA
jgi:pimeloyl-ACP methyl ester carboxylesterase